MVHVHQKIFKVDILKKKLRQILYFADTVINTYSWKFTVSDIFGNMALPFIIHSN